MHTLIHSTTLLNWKVTKPAVALPPSVSAPEEITAGSQSTYSMAHTRWFERKGEGMRQVYSALLRLVRGPELSSTHHSGRHRTQRSHPDAHHTKWPLSKVGGGPAQGGAGLRGGPGRGWDLHAPSRGAVRPRSRAGKAASPTLRREGGMGRRRALSGIRRYLRWKSRAKGFRYGSSSRSRASSGTSARAAASAASEHSPRATGAAIFCCSPSSRARVGRLEPERELEL